MLGRLLLLVVVASLGCALTAVSGQRPTLFLPDVALIEPSVAVLYANPYSFSGVQGGLSVPPVIYGADQPESSTTDSVYLVSASADLKMASSPSTGEVITAIEPRPYGALVWPPASPSTPQHHSPRASTPCWPSTPTAWRSCEIRPVRLAAPLPTYGITFTADSVSPSTYLASTNDGTAVVVTASSQVYLVSATTGLTTAYISLLNNDQIAVYLQPDGLCRLPLRLLLRDRLPGGRGPGRLALLPGRQQQHQQHSRAVPHLQ